MGCHSKCERYKEYVIAKDELNRKIREAKGGEQYAEIKTEPKKDITR